MYEVTGPMNVGYKGKRLVVEEHPVKNGDHSFTQEVLRVKDAVAVLPVFNLGSSVFLILLKHYRFPVHLVKIQDMKALSDSGIDVLHPNAKDDGVIYEVCAGVIESTDPSPESAALRELMEETGIKANGITRACSIFSSPGITTERIHLAYAYGLDFGKHEVAIEKGRLTFRLKEIEGQEGSEIGQITPCIFSEDEIRQMMRDGQITDAKTLSLLGHYFVTFNQKKKG